MREPGRLQGRHALLTGAGGGIGLAVASAFLAEGAQCTLVDLAAAAAAAPAVAALLAAPPQHAAYLACDVARVDRLPALVDEAAQRFGPIAALLNSTPKIGRAHV